MTRRPGVQAETTEQTTLTDLITSTSVPEDKPPWVVKTDINHLNSTTVAFPRTTAYPSRKVAFPRTAKYPTRRVAFPRATSFSSRKVAFPRTTSYPSDYYVEDGGRWFMTFYLALFICMYILVRSAGSLGRVCVCVCANHSLLYCADVCRKWLSLSLSLSSQACSPMGMKQVRVTSWHPGW